MEYPRDPRADLFVIIAGVGQTRPMGRADLERAADTWPTSPDTPEGIAAQLHVARQLYVHSLLVWEFAAVAVSTSLVAVESALRHRLEAGGSTRFKQLIERAAAAGLIGVDLRRRLHAGRELRNSFSHRTYQQVWSPGMASPALHTSFEAVASLFETANPTAP